jgi:2,3-bisphosphoglycerate-dependent phosphoglycerate mutase
MAKLILTRHGQSLWNAENRFTGWVDVPLSEQGRAETMVAAAKLKDYRVRVCFTSLLFRAIETAIIILTEVDDICDGRVPIIKHDVDDADWHGWDQYNGDPEQELPVYTTPALDERYYGELQGLNKAETAAKFGQDQVHLWRRSYNVAPPGGESLEDTVKRTVPFFRDRILKHLIAGDNVLVAAHGNSLRSIIKTLENLSEKEIVKVELGTGIPIIYDIDSKGQVTDKIVLN